MRGLRRFGNASSDRKVSDLRPPPTRPVTSHGVLRFAPDTVWAVAERSPDGYPIMLVRLHRPERTVSHATGDALAWRDTLPNGEIRMYHPDDIVRVAL